MAYPASFGPRASPPSLLRPLLFNMGDGLFLTLVGAVATYVMMWVESSGWPGPIAATVGMAAAMGVQTLMSLAVAPLLGSIESMVPAMVVAMVCPMTVGLLPMVGYELPTATSCTLGAAFGAAFFVYLQVYGTRCRRFPGRLLR